jgi:E3 ubiquitin-protein ligase DOA10
LIDDLEGLNKEKSNHPSSQSNKMLGTEKPQLDNTLVEEKLPINTDKFCKICFESSEDKKLGKLINPCICDGSVKFIHDECLKTWLVSQNKDIQNAGCEICNTTYNMSFHFGSKFYPRQAIKDGYLSLISSICLFILIVSLVTVIIIFSLQW